jgi:hypothetical protein
VRCEAMVPKASAALGLWAVAFSAAACPRAAAQTPDGVLPSSLVTDHLFVYYANGRLESAEKDARTAETCIAQLAALTGLKPTHRIRLYLADTQEQFEALVGEPESFAVQGRADEDRDVIVVRTTAGATMTDLLAHEITHVLLGQALEGSGAQAPRWLDEGYAEWAADAVTPGDQRRRPAVRGRIYSLSDLASAFPRDPAGADLAYAESRSFVDFVQNKTGDRGLRRLIQALRATKSIEPAFLSAYGKPIEDFEKAWEPEFAAGIGRRIDIDPLTAIFMIVSLLFVIVIVVRVRRQRRRRKEEEEEEEELDEDPYWEVPPDPWNRSGRDA